MTTIKLILAGIGVFIAAIFAAFFKGRSNGKAAVTEQVQQQHSKDVVDTAAKQVESVGVASSVKQKTIISSDSTIDSELENKWTRG